MKFSTQATGALLMTLQKCLLEETDIVELINEWNLEGELYVLNPPTLSLDPPKEDQKFEVPKGL
mgnify:CR=1 FL=1